MGVHAGFGLLGLVALPIPLLGRKGGRAHRVAGWTFVAGMIGVSLTGLVITALWLAVPLVVKPPAAGVDPVAQAAEVRAFAVFLGFLAWLILGAVWTGLRVLAVRRGAVAVGHPLDVGIARTTLVLGAALGLAGLWTLDPLYVLFGITGVLTGRQDLASARDTRSITYRHGRAMGGAGIAAVTAFLVFNADRLLALPDSLALLPWVLPTVIGSPLIGWMIRPYRPRNRAAA